MKNKFLSILSVFTSSSTLICCALPALVAAIAGGAAVSSLISIFPWMVPLSQHKLWIFLLAWLLIILTGILIFRNQTPNCDLSKGETGCEVTGKFSKISFYISFSILLFATFFSYALTPILRWVDQLRGL